MPDGMSSLALDAMGSAGTIMTKTGSRYIRIRVWSVSNILAIAEEAMVTTMKQSCDCANASEPILRR